VNGEISEISGKNGLRFTENFMRCRKALSQVGAQICRTRCVCGSLAAMLLRAKLIFSSSLWCSLCYLLAKLLSVAGLKISTNVALGLEKRVGNLLYEPTFY
jgi:hypothetical protein